MSTGDPQGSPNADKASYNPDACQANAVNMISTGTNTVDGDHTMSIQVSPSHVGQRKGGKKRFFGIPKGSAPAYPNPDDYETKYPEDAYGEEMSPSARVWRTYLDEAQKADAELIEGWRDTTDVLLVFAGLFSAVVATFVAQTSNALNVDYAQVTATLLLETNSLLRAMVNQSLSGSIPSSPLDPASSFSSSANDRWINGLWFASLSVSLIAAFMAVLVKQWIQHYQSVVFGTAQEQVQIRQFRYLGVEHWQMPLIVGTLPMLLHLALFLYFIGLIVFLVPLDRTIGSTAAMFAGLAYVFYFISTFLPLWYPTCPYKTPSSSVLLWLSLSLHVLISSLVARSHKFLLHIRSLIDPSSHSPTTEEATKESSEDHSGVLQQLREAEKKAVGDMADELDARAFVWLYQTSSNPTVTSITVQAVSGLRLDFKPSAKDLLKQTITFGWNTVEHGLFEPEFEYGTHLDSQHEMSARMDRLLRSCHQLGSNINRYLEYYVGVVLKKANEPRTQTHLICLSKLPRSPRNPVEVDPIMLLEFYDYESEGPQPVMWIALLKQCIHYSFPSSSECWSHAWKVLLINPPHHHRMRMHMIWEYICSLSFLNPDGERHQVVPGGGWEAHSVLNGAPFCPAKVVPKIYSVLSMAIDVVRDEESSENIPPLWIELAIFLEEAAVSASDFNAEERGQAAAAASRLRISMQKLVELDTFWKDDTRDDRAYWFCLIIRPEYWTYIELDSRISWTPELMDWFLLESTFQEDNLLHTSMDRVYSYFSEGSPQLYLCFLEKDGLSKIDRVRHRDEFLLYYLDGLLHWKGSTADLDRQLDYLFQPERFCGVVREYIFKHNSDGSLCEPVQIQYPTRPRDHRLPWAPEEGKCGDLPWVPETPVPEFITRLFKLRSPDCHPDSYGQYLDPLREVQLRDLDSDLSIPTRTIGDQERPANAPPRGWLGGGRNPLNWVRNTVKRGHDGGEHAV